MTPFLRTVTILCHIRKRKASMTLKMRTTSERAVLLIIPLTPFTTSTKMDTLSWRVQHPSIYRFGRLIPFFRRALSTKICCGGKTIPLSRLRRWLFWYWYVCFKHWCAEVRTHQSLMQFSHQQYIFFYTSYYPQEQKSAVMSGFVVAPPGNVSSSNPKTAMFATLQSMEAGKEGKCKSFLMPHFMLNCLLM